MVNIELGWQDQHTLAASACPQPKRDYANPLHSESIERGTCEGPP